MIAYRRAREALALFNAGKEGAAELAKRPHLYELLRDLCRVQSGDPDMTLDHALEGLRASHKADEEE